VTTTKAGYILAIVMKHSHRLIAAGWLGLVATFGASDAVSSPAVKEVAIECRVSSSNDGCDKVVDCPPGTRVRTARAACNLEYGAVTDEQLSSVQRGYLKVVRSSDHVDEARCWVGTNQVGGGQVAIADIRERTRVSVGCQEHDRNGGDCHIRGSLYCE
jgi:hypothetical protein